MSEPTGARRYGTGGGDAYYDAVKYGGYEGTREQFGKDQAEFATNATAVAAAKEVVEQDTEEVRSTKETFVNTTVPEAITAIQQEGTTQVQAVTQQGEESSQQVEAVGTQWKDEIANEGRARVQAIEQAGTTQVQAVNDAGTTQVGAVNQAGTDQVAAVKQAGVTQVQAVTDEGTTQIGAVTGEGDTQVQRVQDKGDEVIASISADYTELDQEVDNLKSALEAVAKGTAQIGMGFLQGIRYSDSPTTVSTSSTCCTAQKAISMGAKDVIEITIPSGLKAGVVTTLGTDSGWKTSTYTFTATAACDVYLNVAKTSDEGVIPSEITGIVINYTDNSSRVGILEEDDEWLTEAVNRLGAIAPIESPGYINGFGGISEQSSARLEVYTNKIPVSIGDKLTIKLRYTSSHELWVAYAIYKADESYITRVTLVNGTSANYYEETETITNANAQYIAFSYRTYGDVTATIIKENTAAEKLGSPFAAIIPADSVTYPTIDTKAKTLTIQDGTIIIDRRLPSGQLALSNQICDYSSVSSTAILFTWDIANSAIVAFAYTAVIDLANYIPLCSLRTSKGIVGSTIPIMVDGQLYGKVNLDHINQGSLWKNDNVRSINHRGYTVVAPENTLPAFKLSKDMGFGYVETDIRFTSDGVPVLLHDATINRTARNSDGTEISDTINIADITYAEASAYDYGIWKGTAYAGTPIPTFAQFLKACRRLGLRPYIELKAGTQAQIEGLVDTAISCGFKGLATWISFGDTYLSYVKNHASGERLGLIAYTYSSALITTINGLKTPDNEVFLDMTVLGQIDNTVVNALISADIALECFINGNYSIVGANPYITGITTDSDNIGQYMYTLWNHNIYA